MRPLVRLAREIGRHAADLRRVLVLLVVCAACALVVVDRTRGPSEVLEVGDVAPRTVVAPRSFPYTDFARQEALVQEARHGVMPVYVHRADLVNELKGRINRAFEISREQLLARDAARAAAEDEGEEGAEAEPEVDDRAERVVLFRNHLGVHVPDEDIEVLLEHKLPVEAQELAGALVERAMRGYVIADREELPHERGAVRVIELQGDARHEFTVQNLDQVRTPSEARQQVSIALIESAHASRPWAHAVGAIARANVRPNLSFDALQTTDRKDAAAAAVEVTPVQFRRGNVLFEKGDELTEIDVIRYRALQRTATQHGPWVDRLAVAFFLALLLVSLYHFGASYLQDFSTRVRDAAAVGVLLVLTALLARIVVSASEGVVAMIGMEAQASSVWFLVPVAGAAMLVRLLVGVAWTVVFSVAASVTCGLIMDLEALHVVFFVLTSIVAAGAVEHTRERLAVLRAGLFTGVVAAATVLLIHFLQLFVGDGDPTLDITIQPLWSILFAFLGGLLSAFLVLGLIPLFETAGFVTDFRLMELANLNHPLLRQLMLRAPGSYHHSVVVGSLSEAAAEAIGANALQARVASYFHDIGKAQKPHYFVENQRESVSRHTSLDPYTSAKVIIAHVTEGGRLAREHKLPQPIVDNIYMHHGTGLLQYFYAKAQVQAEDPDTVDESAFRYPGPKPDSKEAGIIMLADKVEAATRTIREPNEDKIRAMIHQIINSVMADGQFEHCPLTFQEIHTIAETFVQVLVGIHHQRIEYPATRGISRGATDTEQPRAASGSRGPGVITLEIPSPFRGARTGTDDAAGQARASERPTEPGGDYEAVEHLPRGDS